MGFDPAADPWGAAMLGAAALWLISLLVMLSAVLGGTSRRAGGTLMLVSLLAFLGAAVGGTWDRIRRGDAAGEASQEADAGEVVATAREDLGGGSGEREAAEASSEGDETRGETAGGTAGRSSGTATGGETTGGETTQGASDETTAAEAGTTGEAEPTGGTGEAGTTGEAEPNGGTGEAETTGGEETAEDSGGGDLGGTEVAAALPGEPVVPEDLPEVEPLPTEERAREAAIREILDEGARAAGGGERCGNLQRVAKAWAQLELVPVTRKAKAIAKDLERCRRRLLYSVSQKRLAEMIEDRDRWFAKLPGKLRKQEGFVIQASISGKAHERLRIGNRELDAARADALMDGGLRDELVRLQFARVVISNGKTSKTYELPVTPEGELGLPWLRAVGLGEPLRLAE